MDLRPYQAQAIDEIKSHFLAGRKKCLLHLATGAGKTHCFSYMMIKALDSQKKSVMLVRGRKLVDQASKRLFREGVTHGVLMAGHWAFKPSAGIQICSVDTLIARKWRPKADLIIIDEAHQAVSDGYIKVLEAYPNAFIVAVTATPYSTKSMRHFADAIVHPITVNELIEQGFLVPPRYFAPSAQDTSGVKVSSSTGDYVQDQLAELMDKSAITGDIISHWEKLSERRPTICFAVNVAHSKHIAAQFVSRGIKAEHCDADTPEREREAIIKRVESGETKVVTNIGILCTGVDIPCIGAIIMARPTKSYNLYVQCAGRGTRIYPGKKDFILLDHAGNVARHGFITDEPEPNLDGNPITEKKLTLRTCPSCFAVIENFPCSAEVYHGTEIKVCGYRPLAEEREREIIHIDGELREIKVVSPIVKYECERFCEEEIARCLQLKKNVWSAFYKTKENFGEEAAKLVFFRICKRNGIDVTRKKKEAGSGYPFK